MKIDDRIVVAFQFFAAGWLFAAIVSGFILIIHYVPSPWDWCASVFLFVTSVGAFGVSVEAWRE